MRIEGVVSTPSHWAVAERCFGTQWAQISPNSYHDAEALPLDPATLVLH